MNNEGKQPTRGKKPFFRRFTPNAARAHSATSISSVSHEKQSVGTQISSNEIENLQASARPSISTSASSPEPSRGILRRPKTRSFVSQYIHERFGVSVSEPSVTTDHSKRGKNAKKVGFRPDVDVRVFVSSRESREYRRAFVQAWRKMKMTGKWVPSTSLDDLLADMEDCDEDPLSDPMKFHGKAGKCPDNLEKPPAKGRHVEPSGESPFDLLWHREDEKPMNAVKNDTRSTQTSRESIRASDSREGIYQDMTRRISFAERTRQSRGSFRIRPATTPSGTTAPSQSPAFDPIDLPKGKKLRRKKAHSKSSI